tara:strand:- start:510 stop:740 length:231 start_codon:yes stop_codon:yes gene_type:complete
MHRPRASSSVNGNPSEILSFPTRRLRDDETISIETLIIHRVPDRALNNPSDRLRHAFRAQIALNQRVLGAKTANDA